MTNMDRIKTFAINVKSNEFRKNHILSQAEKAGLDIQIFDAITPETMHKIPNRYVEQNARNKTGRGLFPTEIACGLSHIALWRQLENDPDADYYLILEDDIHITANIGAIIDGMDLNGLDLVKFSGQQQRPMKKISALANGFDLYRYAFGPLDAAAYLISKKVARQMWEYCETLHLAVDVLMDRSYDHGVPVYGVLPYAANTKFCFDEADPLFTDIGIRTNKYSHDVTRAEKLNFKIYRLIGSVKRHLATLKLWFIGGHHA